MTWEERLDQLATDQGYRFDQATADRVIQFIEGFCRQSKGEYAGKPLTLLPWQRTLITRLYGWKRPDGTRRYRNAGIWCAKKNGKSTMLSAIALYHLIADGESGAEVYVIANDQQQAGIVFGESANMVEQSPDLAKRLKVVRSTKRIHYDKTKSVYRALSTEKAGKHGYNSSLCIWDEIAFQPDRELWDILRYSTAYRKQPLTITISTAGYDREGIGFEQYRYAKDVIDGKVEDIHFLPCVYEADPADEWTSLDTARKANPSLVSGLLSEADFIEAIEEAKAEPRKEANYRALRTNIWVGHTNQWLATADWNACIGEFPPLEGKECFAGLDLAVQHDLASYVLCFPVGDLFYLLPRFFLPKDLASRKEHSDKVPYLLWERQGLVTLTPGNVIDYGYIRQSINADAKRYKLVQIGYDPAHAELLCNQLLHLQDGLDVVEIRAGILTMGPLTSHFERLLKEKRLRHNHPTLTWNALNTVVRSDANDNITPSKRSSTARIDGIIASILALSLAMNRQHSPRGNWFISA